MALGTTVNGPRKFIAPREHMLPQRPYGAQWIYSAPCRNKLRDCRDFHHIPVQNFARRTTPGLAIMRILGDML
jgi:hypothetical protein